MPLNFPSNPAVNDQYTFGGRTWVWNGSAWDSYNPGISGYVSALNGFTGGVTLAAGTGITLTNTSNTITIATIVGVGATGPTGPQGNTGATGPVGDYVISFNGATGAVTGVTTGTTNTFTALQTFSNGLVATGATLSGTVAISGLSTPNADSDAANKAYVDNVASVGVHYHTAVVLASTDTETFASGVTYSNGTLGVGATLTKTTPFARLNIDSTDGVTADRILIRSATTQQWNGVYDVTDQGSASNAWILTRSADADNYHPYFNDGLGANDYFFVSSGASLKNNAYICSTPNGITFGTTAITFALFSTPPVYTAGTGLALNSLQFSNTGVLSFNGLTGVVTGVTTSVANTFTALQTFNSGLSASGATFNGNIYFQNAEYIRNTTNGQIDLMPAPASSTAFGLYADMTSWTFGVVLGTIRSSDGAKNTSGNLRFDVPLTINNNTNFQLGSDGQYRFQRTTTGNDTAQFGAYCDGVNNSGAYAIIGYGSEGNANRSPVTKHSNPNLYIYANGSINANDFIRFEHDRTNANIITGQTSGILMQPGSGWLGVSGGISASAGVTFNSISYYGGLATFAGGMTASGGTFSGQLNAQNLRMMTVGGDEGGQIDFSLAATNTGLTGGVAIDVYQNKVRIFETGGTIRGAYLDLTNAAAGVGTDLRGSKTYSVFTPLNNQPPSSNFATLNTRNSIALLAFDASTQESAVFVGVMPESAILGSGLTVRIHWTATSATSGDCVWGVQIERMNTDEDADSFDTAATATSTTNGTSGIITTTSITITTIDSVAAGEPYCLKVYRDAAAAGDTMTGDAELIVVEVRSAS